MSEPNGADSITVAVAGCVHGRMTAVYETLRHIEESEGIKADVLLCCGDFEGVRCDDDLKYVSHSSRFRRLGDFPDYFDGSLDVPLLTVFIGGNHEASNCLWDLYHGGWACPGVFYLGHAGVVNFGGVRIAGCGGIYKPRYSEAGYEVPGDEDFWRSAYHMREYEAWRLQQVRRPVDVVLSHDWPQSVVVSGDRVSLYEEVPHLAREGVHLGNPLLKRVLDSLHPKYWFAAHHHVKFATVINTKVDRHHEEDDLSALSASGPEAFGLAGPRKEKRKTVTKKTKFLALGKVSPGGDFLQVLDIPVSTPGQPLELQYDPEWLLISSRTSKYLPMGEDPDALPPHRDFDPVTDHQIEALCQRAGGDLLVPGWDDVDEDQKQWFVDFRNSLVGREEEEEEEEEDGIVFG